MKWQRTEVAFIDKFHLLFPHMAPQVFVSIYLKGIVEAAFVYSCVDAKTHAH